MDEDGYGWRRMHMDGCGWILTDVDMDGYGYGWSWIDMDG